MDGASELDRDGARALRSRILIADDNADAADTLAHLLECAGYETTVAYDGIAALEIAERLHPDVILLDLGMPQLAGDEVARRVREQPWGRTVRLIAVTGYGHDAHRRLTEQVGFDRHLVKPTDPDTLLRVISELQRLQ